MRIKSENKTSAKMQIKTKHRLIVVGSFCAGIIVFLAASFYSNIGLQHQTKAEGNPSRYPFELSAASLSKVNFTALPLDINSNFAEVRPLISADGSSLFFLRRNHPNNINGEKDDQDIWLSTRQLNGEWSKPENAGTKINTKKADAICSVSQDGSEIYFFTEEMDPNRMLFKSKKLEGGEWSDKQAIAIEDFYNNDHFIDLYYSHEANVLFLAVTRNDSKGEQDIYFSLPTGLNKFSKPQNLGIVVNTEKSDFAPFLAADGRTLYFSSYGHEGLGGCDIYKTTRLDDTWKRWSKPVNLGEGINSDREESYFSIAGNYEHIYFESYDLKKQVRDIFRADLPEIYKPTAANDLPIASMAAERNEQ